METPTRILKLLITWQNKIQWTFALNQADEMRKHRALATESWKCFNNRQGQDSEEFLELFRQNGQQHDTMAEAARLNVISSQGELIEIANYLREHFPTLLEFASQDFDFFDPPDVEFSRRIRALQKIEGEIRLALMPKWSPAGTMKRWEEWFKLAGCASSEDTIEKRIKDGIFTAKQPREKGRLILDINKLPPKMQSEEFWNTARTPQK